MSCDRCRREARVHVDDKHLCAEHAALDPAVSRALRRKRLSAVLDALAVPVVLPVLLVQQALLAWKAKKAGFAPSRVAGERDDRRLEVSGDDVTLFERGSRRWTMPMTSLRKMRLVIPDTPELEVSYDSTLCFVTENGVEWRLPSSVHGWEELVSELKRRRLIEPSSTAL